MQVFRLMHPITKSMPNVLMRSPINELISSYGISIIIQACKNTSIRNYNSIFNSSYELVKKLNRLPMRYFDTKTHGEVLSRFTNDIDTLSQSLNQSLTQIITSVTTIVGVLIMMLSISVVMTLSALIVIPISLFIISLPFK